MPNKKNKRADLLRYAGMAFELFALLFILLFIGQKLDKYFNLEQPFLSVGFLLLGLVAYFVKLIKDVS